MRAFLRRDSIPGRPQQTG